MSAFSRRASTAWAFPSTRWRPAGDAPRAASSAASISCTGAGSAKFPIERVIADIQDAESHGAASIFFPDDNITLDPKRLEQLCQAIIDAGLTHLRYKTQASASGIASSERLVEKMGQAGFDGVFLGVESVNKRNLQFLGKGKMSNDAERAVQYLHDNNIIVSTGLIGGNPEDDAEDIWENFRLARRLKVDVPIFYISTPYPKTQMRSELEEMGLVTKNDFTKYDGLHANLKTKHLSDEEISFITWEMNARYYDLEWFRYNKVKRLYPKWFLMETLRLVPFYARRKIGSGSGLEEQEGSIPGGPGEGRRAVQGSSLEGFVASLRLAQDLARSSGNDDRESSGPNRRQLSLFCVSSMIKGVEDWTSGHDALDAEEVNFISWEVVAWCRTGASSCTLARCHAVMAS